MSQEHIQEKIDSLINEIKEGGNGFQEKDIVYLIIEIYKIKERDFDDLGINIKTKLPYLSFFRDWIVHTKMYNPEWVERKDELNDSEKLIKQLIAVIRKEETKKDLLTLQDSFIAALVEVTLDQPIELREAN